jgi:hypothetical protein
MSDLVRRSGLSRATRLLFAGFGLLLVLIGGYALWWHSLTVRLRGDLDHWVAERAAAGWKISTGAVAVGGFPLHVVMTLAAPGVEDPTGNAWQGPPLTVFLPLLSPRHPHLEAPGQHVFTVNGLDPIAMSAAQASADLVIDEHGLGEASVDLGTASAKALRVDRLSLQLQRLAAGKVEHDVSSWGLRLALDNLALPDDPRLLFGSLLPAARLEARLQGSLSGGSLRQVLTAWRDDGGTVEVDSLSVAWPPLALSGKGTLALDRDLQPILASSCNIRGLFEAIDALTRSGVVRPKDAGMVKLVFGLMMKPDKDGTQALSVPVTIQNRILSIGPAKLFELPVISFSGSGSGSR